MKRTTELFASIAKHLHQPMLVEGKKDAAALQALGFSGIFILNEHQGSLYERVERIVSSLEKDTEVCLLFDNDKAGRKLIACVAPVLRELGIKTNQRFRRECVMAGLSHVEGIVRFLKNRKEDRALVIDIL